MCTAPRPAPTLPHQHPPLPCKGRFTLWTPFSGSQRREQSAGPDHDLHIPHDHRKGNEEMGPGVPGAQPRIPLRFPPQCLHSTVSPRSGGGESSPALPVGNAHPMFWPECTPRVFLWLRDGTLLLPALSPFIFTLSSTFLGLPCVSPHAPSEPFPLLEYSRQHRHQPLPPVGGL